MKYEYIWVGRCYGREVGNAAYKGEFDLYICITLKNRNRISGRKMFTKNKKKKI